MIKTMHILGISLIACAALVLTRIPRFNDFPTLKLMISDDIPLKVVKWYIDFSLNPMMKRLMTLTPRELISGVKKSRRYIKTVFSFKVLMTLTKNFD